jgi:hypothetical protein
MAANPQNLPKLRRRINGLKRKALALGDLIQNTLDPTPEQRKGEVNRANSFNRRS